MTPENDDKEGLDSNFEGLDSEFDAFFAELGKEEEPLQGNTVVQDVDDENDADEPSKPHQEAEKTVPVAVRAQASSKKAKSKPKLKVKVSKPEISKQQKAIATILRRAGKDSLPELSSLLKSKTGEMVAIKDIALFIGTPEDEVMAEVAIGCPLINRVNLSAEVNKSRLLQIGAQIIEAGRMYLPIQVVRIEEDGALECTSGRHRLAFLALVYGPDAKIPINIESMTLNEARDAVVVANDARPTKALERAEHAVMKAVGGNLDAEQDEMFKKTATSRLGAGKYCIFSVLERKYPAKLNFKVSQTASRKDGGLTTITNVENFWGLALEWTRETQRKEFDASLKASVKFLNELVTAMQTMDGFDPKHHLASKTILAIGKYYREYGNIIGGNAIDVVTDIAREIVAMGETGCQKQEKTYADLTVAMRKK